MNMNTITFENGTSIKILIDEMKWTKSSHKYFNSSLNSIVITLLCIQKYYFKQIDKNIFLKIIQNIADDSYLVDVSLFADFIMTNCKRHLYNTYETFRSQKRHLFNATCSKQVNSKYLDRPNALIFTRGRQDLQLILEEIRDHKTLGLVMILCNSIEIIYLDASRHVSGVDLSFSFPFFTDLKKKEEFYELLRNSSVNHTSVSFPPKNKIINTINFIFFLFLLILCYLIYFYELKITNYP